jgi:hypothetical protein
MLVFIRLLNDFFSCYGLNGTCPLFGCTESLQLSRVALGLPRLQLAARPFSLLPLHLGSQCSSELTWCWRPPLFPLLLSESFGRYGSFGRRDGLDSPGGSSQLQDAVGRLGIVQLRLSSNCCPRQWRSLRVASTTADPNAGPLGVVKPGPPIQRWAAVAGLSPLSLLVKPGPPTQPRPHTVAGPE